MSLTDDWKTGKLKEGWYWILVKSATKPSPRFYFNSNVSDEGFDINIEAGEREEDIIEVLAPCDYEELQRLKAKLDTALKDAARFEMKAYDLERELKYAKSRNQYHLKSIKNMTSALDYMMDENEKLQVKYNEDTDKLMRQIVNGREWEKLAKSAYPYRCDTIVGGVSFITIKEENKNFRNLLKECLPYMDIYKISRNEEAKELLNRIEAAIVESEE